MAEQRQRFSFRLPWSVPSASTRRPATNNPPRATSSNNQRNVNPNTTSQRSPSKSPSSSQTPKALPQASTSTKTSSKPTFVESPNVTPQQTEIKTKNPAPTSTPPSQPVVESQRPQTSPLRSLGQVVEQKSSPQTQSPPKQQPSSPSTASYQSLTSSQTPSQSRADTQRRATSKSPPPSNAPPQSRPPSRTSNKSKNASQSPLTSHPKSTVSETNSQPSSPARSQYKNSSSAVYQPRSPPSPGNRLSETITKNMQSTAGAPIQTGSPTKILNPVESALPSPTSSNPPSPISKNQNQALPQAQLQAHPERDNTDEKMISEAPIEATVKPIAAAPSQQSDPIPNIPTPRADEEMTERDKEVLHSNASRLYGKQSKTTASHKSNKSIAGASHQKSMASNGEGISMQKEIKNDISKLTQKMATEQGKPLSVITLVGENKGATMQLGSQKEGAVHIHRGYKLNPDESTEATTDGEESSKDKRPKEANTKEDQMKKAYMNSNSQGINNSFVINSHITERNPGVHLTLTQNPTEPIKTATNANQLVAHKAEANIMPSQKLTYETRIRRRCLRGLLMESSDSDSDNPEKPRRHGCRCSYGDMNKDKEIDLL